MHNKFKYNTYTLLSVISIIIISVIVFFLNHTPGTWQTGWDTLHPEFDFALNIPRTLLGIWQDNQGLGSLGGHSHAADLSRVLIMLLADLIFPTNFLRYFYLLITLIAGPLGTYFFLRLVIFKNIRNKNSTELYGFLGAIFYILLALLSSQHQLEFS